MPLFCIYLIFSSTYNQSITFIKYIHPSPFAEVPLLILIAGQLSGKNTFRTLNLISAGSISLDSTFKLIWVYNNRRIFPVHFHFYTWTRGQMYLLYLKMIN
jgi:hypothetical protein